MHGVLRAAQDLAVPSPNDPKHTLTLETDKTGGCQLPHAAHPNVSTHLGCGIDCFTAEPAITDSKLARSPVRESSHSPIQPPGVLAESLVPPQHFCGHIDYEFAAGCRISGRDNRDSAGHGLHYRIRIAEL